jgi:hypothetical protein
MIGGFDVIGGRIPMPDGDGEGVVEGAATGALDGAPAPVSTLPAGWAHAPMVTRPSATMHQAVS